MEINIKYVDNPEDLRRWNFDEPAITFTDNHQHVAVPLSKVSGLQIKKMLKEWKDPLSILRIGLISRNNQEKRSE